MAGWSTTRTTDQEVHEVAEATKPGGTAMNSVAPGAADAPGAFWFMQGWFLATAGAVVEPRSRAEASPCGNRLEKMV
jgi:hypothetical protein